MPQSFPVTIISPLQVWGTARSARFRSSSTTANASRKATRGFRSSVAAGLTTNVLAQPELRSSVAVVNCARPSAVLHHMADSCRDRQFVRLLTGRLALKWERDRCRVAETT